MISVIVLTKNEEKNIIDCLESISWADEIIILDDFSEDRTLEIIKTLSFSKKIKAYKKRLENDFSGQRNYALSKAKYDWVMFIDADERVSYELRKEINDILIEEKNNPQYSGFFIPRKDVMWGKLLKHGEVGSVRLLRLAKRGTGAWVGKVHEEWLIDGKTLELENYITHFPHPSMSDFLKEINFYTSIRAKELYEKKVQTSVWEIIFYPRGKFLLNFVLKRGFLDGIEGLIFAIVMSFHSFLVRGKLWILWQKD